MKALLLDPVKGPLALLVVVILVMGGVFYFQYGMGLAPCHLCHLQRIPYYGGGLLLLAVLALHLRQRRASAFTRFLLLLIGIGFLIGAGIAFYHVGVERKWWEGPVSCTGGALSGGSLDDAVARLLATPVVRCDAIVWSLFGVTMAGYNTVISLGLGLAALLASRAGRKENA
jgi:disulfide bond formation protein DsbB